MRTLLYSGFAIVSLGLLTTAPASALSHRVQDHIRSNPTNHKQAHSGAKHRESAGRKHSHRAHDSDDMVGMASYYGNESGPQSASGAHINPSALTAAHRSLPFGTKVRVTNQSNGREVVVTINDRGPFVGGRVIDLSTGAADAIGMKGAGIARVKLEVVAP
jgi:peptidoglycan lytic transglycosylase